MAEKSDRVKVSELSLSELQMYLEKLEEWDALEVVIPAQGEDHSIQLTNTQIMLPYVMNDAVECYMVLEAEHVEGTWESFWEGEVHWIPDASVQNEQPDPILVFVQGMEHEIAVRYKSARMELHCYQYHRIGHSWRTEKGEEHWRRLVNLICVLHDKYNYLGETACNELERCLFPLAEFRPLRFWTPIDHSIEDLYEDTVEGIAAIKDLCKLAFGEEPWKSDENELWRLIQWYEALWQQDITNKKLTECIARKMLATVSVYQALSSQIERASLWWPQRTYNPELTEYMEIQRKNVEQGCHRSGFHGKYPEFRKGTRCRLIVEEHPFTVMESEDYFFRTYMIEYMEEKDDEKE